MLYTVCKIYMQDPVTLPHHVNKGPHVDNLLQFYIQLHTSNNKVTAEQYPRDRNPSLEHIYNLQL